MKDFTTSEYLNPVMAFIDALYTPVFDECAKYVLNADVLLKSNHSRNVIRIAAGEPLNFPVIHSLDVFRDIEEYAGYAATYDGELDRWLYNEQNRVMDAVRDRIIEKYGKEKTA